MADSINFPRQALPYSKKTKQWAKDCLLWANQKTFFNYNLVRKSVMHKKINYDLVNGKLHMSDLQMILNPDHINDGFIPDRIQYYPIMNSKMNVLRGEENKRVFDYRAVVTNPTSISEIENNKKDELFTRLNQLIQDSSVTEEQFNSELEKLNYYYTFEWQGLREFRANALLNHYIKELDVRDTFNQGFMDAMIAAEEIYQCDIVGGEPTLTRINPLKIRIFKSGYSNRIEDADIIILEDYWSPARVIDAYGDKLTKKDIEYIENIPDNVGQGATDSMDNIDERYGFINSSMIDDEVSVHNGSYYFDPANLFSEGITSSLLPYDLAGNLRVLRMYWKSKRAILKVKSYDPDTGEEVYNFYPENYVVNKDLGEEAQKFWINEAWEGTMIGDAKDGIFVNMRPRLVQYNRLSNPSRCHFGIVGSVYNLNDTRPFSLVDMMKPYSYLYSVIHDRLNKAIANNWGPILELDLSKVPKGWDIHKWLYYAKVNHLAVIDSFNEGTVGMSTGKLAGAMNNAGKGMINADIGNYIQQQINLLEFIKMEMSEVAGITKQREGQISNRETVGGIERATLQSSHITEWLFMIHDNTKKRALECLLETAKEALRGRSKKFSYILPGFAQKIVEIDGDEFAESDYGIIIDNSDGTQELNSKLDTLAQAALQNQALSFSTIMKIYSTCSMAEKQRLIEKDERDIQERQAQARQEELQANQQAIQMQNEQKRMEMQQKEAANIRDNETKIQVALISARNTDTEGDGIAPDEYSQEAKDKLAEQIKEFNEKMKLEWAKHNETKRKNDMDARLKQKQINKPKTTK